jgi:hypothetical protein
MKVIRSTFAIALLATACAATRVEEPVGTTTTTGGIVNQPGSLAPDQGLREAPPIVVLADDAAAQIASMRCTREDACGNVGSVGAYPSFDACVAIVRHAHRLELSQDQCPRGVDPYALQACVEESRNAGCGEISSMCASTRLCR